MKGLPAGRGASWISLVVKSRISMVIHQAGHKTLQDCNRRKRPCASISLSSSADLLETDSPSHTPTMRFHASTILAAALAVGGAKAQDCLDDKAAGTLATNFGLLISNYSHKLADKTVHPDFVDYSGMIAIHPGIINTSGSTYPMYLLIWLLQL